MGKAARNERRRREALGLETPKPRTSTTRTPGPGRADRRALERMDRAGKSEVRSGELIITHGSGAEGRSAAGAPRPLFTPPIAALDHPLPPPAPRQYAKTASAPQGNESCPPCPSCQTEVLMALENVLQAAQVLDRATQDLEEKVAAARAAGATWEQIGEQLGLTKQGAQQRYGQRSLTVVDKSVH